VFIVLSAGSSSPVARVKPMRSGGAPGESSRCRATRSPSHSFFAASSDALCAAGTGSPGRTLTVACVTPTPGAAAATARPTAIVVITMMDPAYTRKRERPEARTCASGPEATDEWEAPLARRSID
jgi:hypothetical protein